MLSLLEKEIVIDLADPKLDDRLDNGLKIKDMSTSDTVTIFTKLENTLDIVRARSDSVIMLQIDDLIRWIEGKKKATP